MKTIYLAGGCFWGAEEYLGAIHGVVATQVGYANGPGAAPTYEAVCAGSGHAEVVKVDYDETVLPLAFLLALFYDAIDPLAVNRQGGDTGVQYRTGVYYTDPADAPVVEASLRQLEKTLGEAPAVEHGPLQSYAPAEAYHQKYLQKNPGGYCHIPAAKFKQAAATRVNPAAYSRPGNEALRARLTPLQQQVTAQGATEPPFKNPYWDEWRAGLYVDITTGEPLFSSAAKFDCGCGWPSFTLPVDPAVLHQAPDTSHGMVRTEVRSRVGDAHLGHVFTDGPVRAGGLRYCINSAALRFVPRDDMAREGYGHLLDLVDEG